VSCVRLVSWISAVRYRSSYKNSALDYLFLYNFLCTLYLTNQASPKPTLNAPFVFSWYFIGFVVLVFVVTGRLNFGNCRRTWFTTTFSTPRMHASTSLASMSAADILLCCTTSLRRYVHVNGGKVAFAYSFVNPSFAVFHSYFLCNRH
jgi:hypothetical protein